MSQNTDRFNKLTDSEAELLAWLAEECAEVIQIAMKILRHGYESYNPTIVVPEGERPVTNRMRLEEELAHAVCVMGHLAAAKSIDDIEMERHAMGKVVSSKRWLHHQQ